MLPIPHDPNSTETRQNYLNNRDMLHGIHQSKSSFCSFTHPDYHQYDIILPSLSRINIRTIAAAKRARAKRLGEAEFLTRRKMGEKIKLSSCILPYTKIPKTDVIFRIMTFDHIPTNDTRKKSPKRTADHHEIINFPPFQHWKFDENNELVCVGKSHWTGDVNTGQFSRSSGRITHKLGEMILKICDKYSTRGNLHGYCVDDQTYALTQRGWLSYNEITTDDVILSSYHDQLTWSPIKSIYKGVYNGNMHHLTGHGIDALITPRHKLLTLAGLREVEQLTPAHKIIVMSWRPNDPTTETYTTSDLLLIGTLLKYSDVQVAQWENSTTISIPNSHSMLALIKHYVEHISTPVIIQEKELYTIITLHSPDIAQLLTNNECMTRFVASLTETQNSFLLNSIMEYDTRLNITYHSYLKSYVELCQLLCTFSGLYTNYTINDTLHCITICNIDSYGAIPFSAIDFNGGYDTYRHTITPTTPYKGIIWCPETLYGCFVAKRNDCIYITGNTYSDEMRGQAVVQLTQICLQFDESKGNNPFSYFTAVIKNSFVRAINLEKRNQNIRDDILEKNDMEPSFTRTCAREHEAALKRYGVTEVSTKELLARAAKRQAAAKL